MPGRSGGFAKAIWRFDLDATTGAAARVRNRVGQPEIPLASADVQDAILSETSRWFGLSDAHRAKLQARGYNPASIGSDPDTARYPFASLPADMARRSQLVEHLLARLDWCDEAAILGTLGFSRDGRYTNGPISFLALKHTVGKTALIEFARDETWRIVGFQYALDTPEPDNKGKVTKRQGPRRIKSSSTYHVAPGGSGASSDPAVPALDIGGAASVWHTEAVHKANLLNQETGVTALASFGKGNVQALFIGARAVDPEQNRTQVIALDADAHGEREEQRLAHLLHEAGYVVQLARWDKAHGNGPDDALLAGAEFSLIDYVDQRPHPREDVRSNPFLPWRRAHESEAQRDATLQEYGVTLQNRIRSYLRQVRQPGAPAQVGALSVPPGMGKTHAIARLALTGQPGGLDLGIVPPRRDQVREYKGIASLERADENNCTHSHAHSIMAAKGYATHDLHTSHPQGSCAYWRQYPRPEPLASRVYMPVHLQTGHAAAHGDGLVLDDALSLRLMYPERRVTLSEIQALTRSYEGTSDGRGFLERGLQTVFNQVANTEGRAVALTGKALFDALDAGMGGLLWEVLTSMYLRDKRVLESHYAPEDIDGSGDPVQAEIAAVGLPKHLMPAIFNAFHSELPRWNRGMGSDWNSRVEIGRDDHGDDPDDHGETFLKITEQLEIRSHEGQPMPPTLAVDATLDEVFLGLFFERDVEIISMPDVAPPSSMRHYAVRTSRHGKWVMQHRPDEQTRTIAQARYLLRELDPDGTLRANEQVGLVTFKSCEDLIGEALGIPAHRRKHFFGCRGSNDLEDCTLLLVIGTPALQPTEVVRLARALYSKDPTPIDTTIEKGDDGHYHYRDDRCERVSEYTTYAELTQCAHRSRPLRHAGRTVVTMCDMRHAQHSAYQEIGYLPVTTLITQLPQLNAEGYEVRKQRRRDAEQRLQQSAHDLLAAGSRVNQRTLAKAAGVRTSVAQAWLTAQRTAERATDAETPVVLQSEAQLTIQDKLATWASLCNTVPPDTTAPPPPVIPMSTVPHVSPRPEPLPTTRKQITHAAHEVRHANANATAEQRAALLTAGEQRAWRPVPHHHIRLEGRQAWEAFAARGWRKDIEHTLHAIANATAGSVLVARRQPPATTVCEVGA